jgi:hypothetical protein
VQVWLSPNDVILQNEPKVAAQSWLLGSGSGNVLTTTEYHTGWARDGVGIGKLMKGKRKKEGVAA